MLLILFFSSTFSMLLSVAPKCFTYYSQKTQVPSETSSCTLALVMGVLLGQETCSPLHPRRPQHHFSNSTLHHIALKPPLTSNYIPHPHRLNSLLSSNSEVTPHRPTSSLQPHLPSNSKSHHITSTPFSCLNLRHTTSTKLPSLV